MLKQAMLTAAAGVLSIGLSATAYADFIDGSVSFSDGLDNPSNIVSDLTLFELGDPTNASGGNDDFSSLSGQQATVSDIDTDNPAGDLFAVGGFTFTLSAISGTIASPPECLAGLCGDEVTFDIAGTVSGNGFETTNFIGNFTAQGTCREAGNSGRCQPGTQTGSWSASIVTLPGSDTEMPVPGTVGLLGIGLLVFRFIRLRRA
jgi:hypothetical protein